MRAAMKQDKRASFSAARHFISSPAITRREITSPAPRRLFRRRNIDDDDKRKARFSGKAFQQPRRRTMLHWL